MKDHFKWATTLAAILVSVYCQAYWQQTVNYNINVRLNDQNHKLKGNIAIDYHNNSSDTLYQIFMHLWPNAYRNNNSAFAKQQLEAGKANFHYADKSARGFIDSLDFKVDGEFTQWQYHDDHIDIGIITLNKPLYPGDSIQITTAFLVKIPEDFSRLGHDGQSYQITQWYPKPAVYDQDGWHPLPYLDQGEFYSEFGSFDVKITLPKNYVVGATGSLQNEEERKWLNRKAKKTAQKSSFDASDMDFPPSSKEMKTLHYHADNVHDFAWFADKRYNVLKGAVKLPLEERTITTWTMFTNAEADQWKNSIEYVNKTISRYSKWIGNYPYPQATAVLGALSAGGGMEYPMVTVISGAASSASLERVIAHEVGHNWFYGILGTNERLHAWMDEGLNSYYEHRYMELEKQQETNDTTSQSGVSIGLSTLGNMFGRKDLDQRDLLYLFQAYRHKEQPITTHSARFTGVNYGAMVYMKMSLYLEYMAAYLGEDMFDRAMHHYFKKWKFKHPQPSDLRETFENTGKEVSWFFDHMLATTWKLDYELKNISKDTIVIGGNRSEIYADTSIAAVNAFYELTIKNNGGIKGPYPISAIKDDEIVETIWYGGFVGKMKVLFPEGDYDALKIDAQGVLPEINRKNNKVRTNGMFRKTEKLRLQTLMSLHNGDRTEINYFPLIGWNNFDKTMVGMAFYNSLLFSNDFEYFIAPMFGIGSKDITGMARFAYNWYPKGSQLFDYIRFEAAGKTFTESYYNVTKSTDPGYLKKENSKYYKVQPSVTFNFAPPSPRSKIHRKLTLRNIEIFKDEMTCATKDKASLICTNPVSTNNYMINEIEYQEEHKRTINPYGFKLNVQQGDQFLKAFGEAKYQLTYNADKQGLDIRLFGGSFIYNNNSFTDVRFRLNGWQGRQDYTYDHTYLDRGDQDPVLGRQIAHEDGGFKTNNPIGQTDQWLVALNLESSLPFTGLIKVFADVGTYHGAGTDLHPNSETVAYNTGLVLTPKSELFEIYVPVYMSNDLYGDLEVSEFYKRITFTLRLHRLDVFKFLRDLNISSLN